MTRAAVGADPQLWDPPDGGSSSFGRVADPLNWQGRTARCAVVVCKEKSHG
ncbi:hypothetical protein ACVB9L_10575 [Rothia kristinae]|uniref:hypothetical protein n=1 Tax=Rothia kristinae TaxID=37923 RepID=UPI0022E41D93|nr:hypothetical protein [Rothia kristinae]